MEYRNLEFLGSRKSNCTTNVSSHKHKFYELNFLTSGNTRMKVGKLDIEFNSFDFLLIPPGHEHLLYESKYDKFDNYVIWFKLDNPDFLDKVIKLHDNNGSVRFLCSEIFRLYSSSKHEEDELIKIYLEGVLYHMNKGNILDVTKPNSNTDDIVAKATELINRNIRVRKYSIQELADDLNISTSYLTRIFKEKLGMSPLRYMNEIKIASAKEELVNTSTPIKMISANLNFSDPLYFSRIFSKLEGVSPNHYRMLFRQKD